MTDKHISKENVLKWVGMMLRGMVANVGAPHSYSTWNVPSVVSYDCLDFILSNRYMLCTHYAILLL